MSPLSLSKDFPGDTFWQRYHDETNGAARFRRRELLDSYILKAWFSKRMEQFKTAWNNAIKKALLNVDALQSVVDDDDGMDEDAEGD